jgi:hypothetical protein
MLLGQHLLDGPSTQVSLRKNLLRPFRQSEISVHAISRGSAEFARKEAAVYPWPRMLPPPAYYLPLPGRRFFIHEY